MDSEEYTQAVRRNNQRLYLIALSFTQSHADAEDILQNVFLKLWKYNKAFTGEEHLDKWLTAVCVNESKNLLRSPFHKRTAALDEASELYTFDSPRDNDVFSAVMSLPKKERTVIHLFYYEDLSVSDIAKTLHIKESAVKTRLHRARQKLKESLGDDRINE